MGNSHKVINNKGHHDGTEDADITFDGTIIKIA